MNQAERDKLLGKLDERTINIYRLVERQEKHLAKLNDNVAENTKRSTKNATAIYWIKWVMGVIFLGIVAALLKSNGVF